MNYELANQLQEFTLFRKESAAVNDTMFLPTIQPPVTQHLDAPEEDEKKEDDEISQQ